MKHTGLVLIALILVGGLVFAAGCIAAPQTQSLEGKWILTGIGSGSNAEHPAGIISMEIAGTNVSGNAGVNLYHGTITVENGKVTFSPMATTRMAGPENMMTQEQNFLAALQNVTGYTVANGVVTYNTDIPSTKTRETPEQSPAIRGSRNQSRPLGYIPILFGKRRVYADLIATPYTMVENGEQYFYQLFCCGQKNQTIDTSY